MNPADLTKEITEAVMTATVPQNIVSVDHVGSVLDTLSSYASTLTVADGTTFALIVGCLILAPKLWEKYKSNK